MKRRLIIFSACFLTAAGAAWSQTKPNAIVFEMKDGSSISYMFEEMPKLRFTTEDIVVTTQLYETTYKQNSVQRYQFAYKEPASIAAPTVEETRIVGDELSFSNLVAGTSVCVYSTDGKQLVEGKADSEGKLALSLASFPAGIYLVMYSNKTVKIRKS